MNTQKFFGMGKTASLALLLLAVALVSLAMVVTRPSNSSTRVPQSAKPVARPASAARVEKSLTATHDPARHYGRLPLRFEANQGQTDASVKFLSRGNGYALFLTGEEAVLTLKKAANDHRRSSEVRRFPDVTDNAPRTTNSVLRVKLVDANPSAHVTGVDELPGKSNYFVGDDPRQWRTNVANYARVKYENVYPGIDLLYYGKQRKLEYDFVIAPGADPQAIRMIIQGAASVSIEPRRGSLLVRTAQGVLRFHKPVVFQEQLTVDSSQLTVQDETQKPKLETRLTADSPKSKTRNPKSIDGRYILTADNRISFKIGAYDHTKPLIIDPVLSYSTYLGGSADDEPNGVVVDNAGNAYVTGLTFSANFPTTSGALEGAPPHTLGTGSQCNNCHVVFVTKLNPSGSALVYSTFLGGDHFEEGTGIAVDSSGNAYITGETRSTNFPTTSGAFQTTIGGTTTDNVPGAGQGGDAFLTVLNPTGSGLVYSTYLGGSGTDEGNAIAVDAAGIAYITGGTTSPNFPTTSSAFQTSGTGETVFVAKIDPSKSGAASLVYSTYLGMADGGAGFGIALDSTAQAYVTGMAAPNFPTTSGAFQTTATSASAFVSKIDTTKSGAASLVYSTYLASDGGVGYAIAVDTSGNAYVTGQENSATFPTTPGAFQSSSPGTSGLSGEVPAGDAFVTKLNAAGSALIYSTLLGGSGGDEAKSIAVDSAGNAYVTGYTQSTDFPTAIPFIASFALQTCSDYYYGYTFTCGTAAFATKINATGSAPIYSTYLDDNTFGAGGRRGIAISVDASGNAYIAGTTHSGLPVTTGSFQTSPGGGNDGFVAKIGSAPGPGAKLSNLSLDFGNQASGTTSGVRTVTLEDVGDGPLTDISIAPSGDFAETNDCGSSLAAGALCTISIKFTPTVTGLRKGAITVTDNALDSPQTIALTGSDTSGAVSLSSTSLNFGSQNIGTVSPAQILTLTNVGSTPLTITGISTRGDFALTHNCGATVAPGANCTINVTFTPSAAGLDVGGIYITDSAPDSPQSVTLSGTGSAPPDFSMYATITSAAIPAGLSTAYSITITPAGGFKQAVALGCSGAPLHATCTVSPASVTLDGTNPANVTVTVTTAAHSMVAPQFWSRPPAVWISPPRIREDGYLGGSIRMWLMALALMIGLGSIACARVGEVCGMRLREGSRRAPVRLGFASALLSVVMLASISMSACGGGSPTPPVQTGTPAGTYTLTVTGTATSGTATLTHNINLTLTVN